MTELISSLVIPIVLVVLCVCFIRDDGMMDSFLRGARDGLATTVKILPTMVLLLVSLYLFTGSGAADGLSSLLSPYTTTLGIPSGLIPLILTRPFSGSASTAAYTTLLDTFGADSFEGFAASILMGSGDTLVYVISLYYSATRVKKTCYVFPIAVFVMLFSIFFSCVLAHLFYCPA